MTIASIRFGPQIAAAAAAHHLDPTLLAAVAAQESGGPGASSGRNIVGDGGHGVGVFQIDDRAWAFARTPAALDPARNADFAAGILADDLQRSGGNVRAALSAYNTGSPTATGTTTTWPDGSTLGYADSVLRHYDALASGAASSNALAAENPATLAGVAAPADAAYGLSLAPFASLSGAADASSAYAPVSSWNQVSSASAKLGADADATMAGLIDEGDPFAGDGDDG